MVSNPKTPGSELADYCAESKLDNEQHYQLLKRGLLHTQKHIHRLQTPIPPLSRGSDRAAVQRELKRYRRVERAIQRVLQLPVAGSAEFFACHEELQQAMARIENSPDAAAVWGSSKVTLN
jgi:hypothetical protein